MVISLSATDIPALVAVLLLGLSAGLFFAFSVAVMPGLRRTDDAAFVATMTAINRAILNLPFGLVFVGALIAPVVAAILAFLTGASSPWLLIAAAAVYLVGVLFVTGGVNVPLNEALDRDGKRRAFEARWVRFNNVRTASGIVAFALALVAL
ncbi:MAG: hypothetical protein JWR04_3216 [Rhodoglobus sp.]|nr:hypothetical protein [Rhodoglobus sp.]